MKSVSEIKQLRSFGLLVGGIFLLIGAWPLLFRGEGPRLWGFIVAALLIFPAVIFPKSLRHIYRLWMMVGDILGKINTKVILGIVFYFLVTPMGIVRRLLKKDPICRKFDPEVESYRVLKVARPRAHMERQH